MITNYRCTFTGKDVLILVTGVDHAYAETLIDREDLRVGIQQLRLDLTSCARDPYRFPPEVRAPLHPPRRTPGVRLGQRWREYARRK